MVIHKFLTLINVNMKKLISIIFISIILSSCATQRFNVDINNKRQYPKSNPHYSELSHFFLGGLGQTSFNNAAALCKESGGVDFIEVKQTFTNGLLSVLTYLIYTPRTENIYCKNN